MFANSLFLSVYWCALAHHMPIVFQGFLYSQTFTFKNRFLSSWEWCPCPALPLMWCLQGMGKRAGRARELILAQASPGLHGWTTPFGLKWKNGLWLKPKPGLGVTNTEGQKWADQILEALLLLLSLMLWNYLSPSKNPTQTAKNNKTNTPFPKPFPISQPKAEW